MKLPNLWKSKAYWITLSAALAVSTFTLINRKMQKTLTPLSIRIEHREFIKDKYSQDLLLSSLPANQKRIIQDLLNQGFNICPPYPKSIPFPGHKGFRWDISRLGENCFGTAGYVLTGGKKHTLFSLKLLLSALERLNGYRKAFETDVFWNNNGKAEKIDINKIDFKPGDLLAFGGYSIDRENKIIKIPLHAAVYLGKINGEHYVFQKRNAICGPRSPFEIISLDFMLAPHDADVAMLYKTPHYFAHNIVIYRANP